MQIAPGALRRIALSALAYARTTGSAILPETGRARVREAIALLEGSLLGQNVNAFALKEGMTIWAGDKFRKISYLERHKGMKCILLSFECLGERSFLYSVDEKVRVEQ